MRAAVVGLAVLALLAGCSLDTAGTGGSPSPVETRADGTAQPCTTDLLLTDDGNEQVTPRPVPV